MQVIDARGTNAVVASQVGARDRNWLAKTSDIIRGGGHDRAVAVCSSRRPDHMAVAQPRIRYSLTRIFGVQAAGYPVLLTFSFSLRRSLGRVRKSNPTSRSSSHFRRNICVLGRTWTHPFRCLRPLVF